MGLDNVLQETADLDALKAQQQEQRLRADMAAPRQPAPRASLGSVVQFEKTDIQLWVDVAILVVLVLILMRQ